MPLIQYLLFAGAGLLALLFLSDAYLQHEPLQPPVLAASKPAIRIASHRKAPPPVVIESTRPSGSPMEATPEFAAARPIQKSDFRSGAGTQTQLP